MRARDCVFSRSLLKKADGRPATAVEAESNLHLLGLVGIAGPAKPSARATIAAFRTADHSHLITGDHPATAAAIAAQVGIASETQVIGGSQLGSGGQDRLLLAPVIARALPNRKWPSSMPDEAPARSSP